MDNIQEHGEHYHRVYDAAGRRHAHIVEPLVALCEQCGGYQTESGWVHRCLECGQAVEPGKLRGMFVPHKCPECEQAEADKDRARGNVCLRCRDVRSRCCC